MGKCLSCLKTQKITGCCSNSASSESTKSKNVVGKEIDQADVTETRSIDQSNHNSKRLSLDSKLNALFDIYCDPDNKDMIFMDGVEKLFIDLGIQSDDFRVLLLAWKFDADEMCQFSRQELITGCKEMDVETIAQIRTKLAEMETSLIENTRMFKDLYRFTFKYGLDNSSGQRALPINIAVCLWKLIFSMRKSPIVDKWLLFLQNHPQYKGISRDTWNMFLNFFETVGDDLSSYDDSEAWPSIFDDFVEFERNKTD